MQIDHHLQLAIVQKLANSNASISYSDLKQPEIENSLFSYHLNKLIRQGLVQKENQAYTLTVDGLRWLNDNGIVMRPTTSPRISIALVVVNKEGNYLIGQRTGQFKTKINDYLLPSLYYTNEMDLSDQIEAVIAKFIPEDCIKKRIEFGFTQIKAIYNVKPIRLLFSITHCLTKVFDPLNPLPRSEYLWLAPTEIEKIDHPSATLIRQILEYTNNNKNIHETPMFSS
jgi:hypothetical protein